MKHIEVSKKINLTKATPILELKKALLEDLEKAIEIEDISDGDSQFKIKGTTGSPASMTRHARLNIDVNIKSTDTVARIIISGYTHAAKSLIIFYSFAFFILLLVGLLPGFIETSAENSSAIDALFFLIFGIFIVFDVNSKLAITKDHLETALESLDTMFG